jgi:hypothetical protein
LGRQWSVIVDEVLAAAGARRGGAGPAFPDVATHVLGIDGFANRAERSFPGQAPEKVD